MNLLKYVSFAVAILAVNFPLSTAFADTVELPMLRTLAEPELRAETGIIQYQEDPQEVRALQHRVMKIQLDTQNFVVDPTIVTTLELVPEGPIPDLNNLPLGLQQYVLAIARGLQSPDPREGLYMMLASVYRGIAIPIVWTLLNKRGNSDTKERIALIQRFISIFGKDRIVNVFADREFIGEQWFTWLIEQEINFCIRVKKTLLSPII